MRGKRLLAVAAGVAAVAALVVPAGGAPPARSGPARRPAGPGPVASARTGAVSVTVRPDVFRPSTRVLARPPTTDQCQAQLGLACYRPAQIQQAYGLPKLYSRGINGTGQTIVIVDPFGSPTISTDLMRFDRGFGLPNPPSLSVIHPAGSIPPYRSTGARISWALETTLDVEYAHVIAPYASIVLVETPANETEGTAGFPQIVTAEQAVIKRRLGDVISQSFSATEQSFGTARSLRRLRTAYRQARAAGITVLASSGDDGAANPGRDGTTLFLHPTVNWPASDPLVTGVGGTRLHLNGMGNRTGPDTVWNDTGDPAVQEFFTGGPGPNPFSDGGGKSVIFGRPSYQDGVRAVVGRQRGVPDISMSAACNGSVVVYLSPPGVTPGYQIVCGTSEATPEFAGIVALTAQDAHHRLGPINPLLYQMLARHAPGLVLVTSGNNTVSFTQSGRRHMVTGFAARRGYDLATGVGTLRAPAFVHELAKLSGEARR